MQMIEFIKRLNKTTTLEFILMDYSDDPAKHPLLFSLLLCIYLTTMVGNLLIILTIMSNACFHSPMYYFLSILSLIDLFLSSTTVPKMLVDIQTGTSTISFNNCMMQMNLFICFSGMETSLLRIMSYDLFVPICLPLSYVSIMTLKLCALLVASSWIFAILSAQINTILLVQLSFCKDNKIPQFFCDIGPLLKLSCSDTYINELFIFIEVELVVVVSFISILVSYILIGYAIVRIPPTTGKFKAFSTCSSHICVVLLFFGTIIGVYLCPSNSQIAERDKATAVMYTVITPLLNPFIYSLRNSMLTGVLRKTIQKKFFFRFSCKHR